MGGYSLYRVAAEELEKDGDLQPAETLDFYDPQGCGLVTVYVHGFSNNEEKVTKRWRVNILPVIKFLAPRPACDMMLFFWPSDADITKVFDAIDYPHRVETAISAGVELAEYLWKLADEGNPNLRVQLAGHSLGCRVVLSAAEHLAEQPQKVPVERVLLMGAAVPEGDCTDSGPWPKKVSERFSAPPGHRPAGNSDVVLFSRDDEILAGKFRRGEKKARERGVRSSDSPAVGLTGGPGGKRWTGAVACHGLGHSDYLTEPSTLWYVAAMVGRVAARPSPARLEGHRSLGERQQDERHLASRIAARVTRLS